MTAKLTIPPLMPSAEERSNLVGASFRVLGPHRTISIAISAAHRDGYLAGIDAVIAALREPDVELARMSREGGGVVHLGALADELERRKP